MASSLSDDEFQRIQLQILELRTENYTLADKCKRQDRELVSLRGEADTFEKELQRANKALNKSKKAKEVDLLLQENDALQRKLLVQEEDFRLQNETIMKELGQVIETNEKLDKELKNVKESAGSDDSATSGAHDELRRLHAENNALQKNLIDFHDSHEAETLTLQQTISELEAQCKKLAGRRETPLGQNSESRQVEGQSDQESAAEDSCDGYEAANQNSEIPANNNSEIHPLPSKQIVPAQNEDSTKLINELKLKLDTEREENKLLIEQLQNVEKSSKEQQQALQEEIDKLTEKFKKKQESFVHLQEEKEKLYTKLSAQIESLENRKENEVKKISTQAEQMQSELSMCNKTLEELQKTSAEKITDLETKLSECQDKNKMLHDHEKKADLRIKELENLVQSLEEEVDEVGLEKAQVYVDEIDSLKKASRDWEQNTMALRQNVEDLATQLQESKAAHQSCIESQNALQADRDKQITALQEINRIAEKRKALLDELAIKYQTASEQHREQTKGLEQKHSAEVESLSSQIQELEKRLKNYADLEEKLEESKKQVEGLENTRGWLERRLTEVEANLCQTQTSHEEKLAKLIVDHATKVERLKTSTETAAQSVREDHAKQLEILETKLFEITKERDEKDRAILTLEQEIKDGEDAKKVHEKKGMTVVKDLKKQLVAERKRAERLQERLQEYLQSDSRSRTSVEELLRNSGSERYHGDGSSVGSWSAAASGVSRDGTHSSVVQSPEEEVAPPSAIESEHSELLNKVAELQQQKWTLEEKVSHLESSNAAMCEDLISKTSIIEHYVMNSRTGNIPPSASQDRLSFRRVIDFVKDKGDEDMREMNRKLQTMLEETLTKNMHLQQNMEDMSLELVRLSKQGVTQPTKEPNK